MNDFKLDLCDIKSYYMIEPKKGTSPNNNTTIQFISKDGSSSDKFYFYPLDTPTFTLNMQQ